MPDVRSEISGKIVDKSGTASSNRLQSSFGAGLSLFRAQHQPGRVGDCFWLRSIFLEEGIPHLRRLKPLGPFGPRLFVVFLVRVVSIRLAKKAERRKSRPKGVWMSADRVSKRWPACGGVEVYFQKCSIADNNKRSRDRQTKLAVFSTLATTVRRIASQAADSFAIFFFGFSVA